MPYADPAKERAYQRARHSTPEGKAAHAARQRAWRAANPEKVASYRKSKKRTAKGIESERKRRAEWNAAHPEAKRRYKRRWREANKDKARAQLRAWRAAHPSVVLLGESVKIEHLPEELRPIALLILETRRAIRAKGNK